MSKEKEKQEKLAKRAAALRENLKKRKAVVQARKNKNNPNDKKE